VHSFFSFIIFRPPSSPLFPYTTLFRSPSYVSPAYHLLEGFPFIQEPPSGDLQERVLIRHHDYDQCFQSVQLLQITRRRFLNEWRSEEAVQQECRDRSRMPSSA